MVAFDPRLALEILQRRHRRLEDAGIAKAAAAYVLLWAGADPYDPRIADLEAQKQDFYDEGDRMWDVFEYLNHRIAEDELDILPSGNYSREQTNEEGES